MLVLMLNMPMLLYYSHNIYMLSLHMKQEQLLLTIMVLMAVKCQQNIQAEIGSYVDLPVPTRVG